MHPKRDWIQSCLFMITKLLPHKSNGGQSRKPLSFKLPFKIATDDTLDFFFRKKNKAEYFMWIVHLIDNSHEMSKPIFLWKIIETNSKCHQLQFCLAHYGLKAVRKMSKNFKHLDFWQKVICKQYRPRSDCSWKAVWSGSTLFAIPLCVLRNNCVKRI